MRPRRSGCLRIRPVFTAKISTRVFWNLSISKLQLSIFLFGVDVLLEKRSLSKEPPLKDIVSRTIIKLSRSKTRSQLSCSPKRSTERRLLRLHCLNRIRKVFYGSTLEEMGGTYSNFTRHNGKSVCYLPQSSYRYPNTFIKITVSNISAKQ